MVSFSHEGVYTRADISIANHTDTPLNMSPEDFRVEVLTPKPKVLLYISPAHLAPPPPPLPPAPTPAPAPPPPPAAAFLETKANPAPQTTDVEALYAAAEQK